MNSTSAAPNAHEVMQAPLIGSFFNLLFYGVSCVQTFLYYQTYPDDNISLKLLVAVIWILETVQSGSTISFNNTYLIQGFALAYISCSPLLTVAYRDLVVACEVGLAVMFLVNMYVACIQSLYKLYHPTTSIRYFTWRVWRFSENVMAARLLVFLSISRFAVVLGTTATILAFIYNTWEAFEPHAFAILAATMSLAVVEDTLMALILTYYLYSRRTARSAQLVTRLLAYIVGTGALTSMGALMELVALSASPHNLLYLSIIHVLVYANSALLSLGNVAGSIYDSIRGSLVIRQWQGFLSVIIARSCKISLSLKLPSA
ncbi:hypothetical protein V8B97DRAFT_2108453 [Scleroderma yunnanense]